MAGASPFSRFVRGPGDPDEQAHPIVNIGVVSYQAELSIAPHLFNRKPRIAGFSSCILQALGMELPSAPIVSQEYLGALLFYTRDQIFRDVGIQSRSMGTVSCRAANARRLGACRPGVNEETF
jgi:hypothetical protein